jgi:hypothetical protein
LNCFHAQLLRPAAEETTRGGFFILFLIQPASYPLFGFIKDHLPFINPLPQLSPFFFR